MTLNSGKNHTEGVHIINSAGIVYHQDEVLHIIIAKVFQYIPNRVMKCKGGNAAFDDIHASRDDMPLLSQWIKNRQAEACRFLAEMVGFEPTCPVKDKTISSRSRYDHFDTSPCSILQTLGIVSKGSYAHGVAAH